MFNTDQYYAVFWARSDSTFENIRQLVIADNTNKNANDFSTQRLIIEDHRGYGVIFDRTTDTPAAMSGLKEIWPGVGRLLNRHYVFPQFRARTRAEVVSGLYIIRKLLLEPLAQQGGFDTHIMTMPSRGTRNNFFDAFHATHNQAWPGHWHRVPGYVQTGRGTSRRAWQNAVTDNPHYPFSTIDHTEWLKLK